MLRTLIFIYSLLVLCAIDAASGQLTRAEINGYTGAETQPVNLASISSDDEKLSLQQAISIALRDNPLIHSAQSQLEAARGRFWREISPPPPSVGFEYNYIPNNNGIHRYNERSIGISQSFEFPTTYILRGSAAKSESHVTQSERTFILQTVVAQTKMAYFHALTRERKLALAQENLKIAVDFLRKAEIRFDAGEGTNLERLTAKVQFTQAQNSVEVAKNDLTLAFGELQLALGRGKDEPTKSLSLIDSLAYEPFTESLVETINYSFDHNSQIQSAYYKIHSAQDQHSLAWSTLLPGFNAAYSKQARDGIRDYFGVSFGITIPLWFAFDQRGKIQETSAIVTSLESKYEAIRNTVYLETKNSYTDLKNDERQVMLYRTELLPQADEVYRTAQASYDAGESSYLEFLQAQQTLITTRSGYIDALYDYAIAFARLEYVIGKFTVNED